MNQRIKNNLKRISGMMNKEIRYYLRHNPRWFIEISRYPNRKEEMIQQYKDENNLTFTSKVEQLSMILNMVEMMM